MASTSDLSLVSVEARRKEEEVQVVDEGDVVFVSENAASKTARRSRAIVSARRFHDRNMAAIQRQAERGRKKRHEYETKREKIKKDLNQQNEEEERRAELARASRRASQPSGSREAEPGPARQPRRRNTDRDLELLDMQREQFFSGLMDSHVTQRQQMEEYELALALSLSMAEADGRSPDIVSPSPNLMYPTSLVSPAFGPGGRSAGGSGRRAAGARGSNASTWQQLSASSSGAGAAAGGSSQWETDGMSYEELVQLEDVKVTATKSAIDRLETTVLSESCPPDELCSICQCGFDKGEKMKKLPCGHFFHAECADEWLGKYSKSCPICKENIC